MPANNGRPVGEPIVVVVVDVVVDVVVVVVEVVVDVVVASIAVVDGEEAGGDALCEDEHPAATSSETVNRPTRLRRIDQN